jgi:hypothetical protein
VSDAKLDETVRRMLASETFEPDELRAVLVKQGHDEASVAASIDRVSRELAERDGSEAKQRSLAARRRAGRLIRAGLFWLAVGLGFSIYYGAGLLSWVLVVGIGAALIGAGFRALRSA